MILYKWYLLSLYHLCSYHGIWNSPRNAHMKPIPQLVPIQPRGRPLKRSSFCCQKIEGKKLNPLDHGNFPCWPLGGTIFKYTHVILWKNCPLGWKWTEARGAARANWGQGRNTSTTRVSSGMQDDSGLVRIEPTKGRRLCTGVMAIKTAGRRGSYCWKPRRFPDYHRHVGNLPQTYHGKAVVEIPPVQMVILGLGDDLFSASLWGPREPVRIKTQDEYIKRIEIEINQVLRSTRANQENQTRRGGKRLEASTKPSRPYSKMVFQVLVSDVWEDELNRYAVWPEICRSLCQSLAPLQVPVRVVPNRRGRRGRRGPIRPRNTSDGNDPCRGAN